MRALACIAALALAGAPAVALGDARKPAEKLMDDGTRAFNAGRLEEALSNFEAAHALVPDAAGPLRAMGVTLARLDRCADALGPLGEFVAKKKGDTGAEATEASDTLARCTKLLAERTTLSVTSNVAGAAVRLDDGAAPAGTVPVEKLRVTPGVHAVRVEAEGWSAAATKVDVTLGASVALHVELARAPAVAAAVAAPAPEVGAGARGKRRVWIYIAAGGGAALAAAAVVVVLSVAIASGAHPDLELGPPFRL
jgi:hypothetical protein